ncbi:MAG: hypothetical protein Q8Q09_06480 [Deltaproteobacteria bacterium]|nr:hypothetical protein [Deltaproteobacteria bacterium]
MIGGIITILGGLLAASGLIIKRRPDAQQMIDKLAPYQGWIGVTMFIWGIKEIFSVLTSIRLLSVAPLRWIFWTLSGVSDLLVGFLLGFGLITHYALSKNEQAKAKGAEIRGKLVGIQGPLGIVTIILGALYLVMSII